MADPVDEWQETVQDIYDLMRLDGGDLAVRVIALLQERHPGLEERDPLKERGLESVCEQLSKTKDSALADIHASLCAAGLHRSAIAVDEARGHLGNALIALRRCQQ